MDEETLEIMMEYNLDEETAKGVREIMDNCGVDVDDAMELEGLI